jgi:hypothetical protein
LFGYLYDEAVRDWPKMEARLYAEDKILANWDTNWARADKWGSGSSDNNNHYISYFKKKCGTGGDWDWIKMPD